eukprot:12196689-Karenia_brevis.AAC.1
MLYRFSTGQVILDNDIRRVAWRTQGDIDPRDAGMPQIDRDIKDLLAQCPGRVLTIPCVRAFCSLTFDDLASKNKERFAAAHDNLSHLFKRMEEYNLGRVLGE